MTHWLSLWGTEGSLLRFLEKFSNQIEYVILIV